MPNPPKNKFCRQNCEIHGNLGGQEPGTKKNMNIFYLKKCACPTSKKQDFAAKIVKFMEIWEVRSRGRNKQFEYLLFEKMRLPSQAPGTKRQSEYLLFEKMRLPSQAPGTKRQSEYLLFEKMRLPKLQIARFCSQNCDIHENLGGQGLGTEKSI